MPFNVGDVVRVVSARPTPVSDQPVWREAKDWTLGRLGTVVLIDNRMGFSMCYQLSFFDDVPDALRGYSWQFVEEWLTLIPLHEIQDIALKRKQEEMFQSVFG